MTLPLCQASGHTCGGPAEITAAGLAPSAPLEAAVLITLAPGPYTAIVSGFGGSTGVGLVEVFEAQGAGPGGTCSPFPRECASSSVTSFVAQSGTICGSDFGTIQGTDPRYSIAVTADSLSSPIFRRVFLTILTSGQVQSASEVVILSLGIGGGTANADGSITFTTSDPLPGFYVGPATGNLQPTIALINAEITLNPVCALGSHVTGAYRATFRKTDGSLFSLDGTLGMIRTQ